MIYFAIAFLNWLIWVYVLRCGKRISIEASLFWPIVWIIGITYAMMFVIMFVFLCFWTLVAIILDELGLIDTCKDICK